MDFGALVLAQINAAGLARRAEDRSFTHWQMGNVVRHVGDFARTVIEHW